MLSLFKYLPIVLQAITVLLGVISALTMAANAVLAAIPLAWRTAVVRRFPRAAHLGVMLRTGGTHLTAFLVAALAFLRGLPMAQPSASAPMGQRASGAPMESAPTNSHGFATARSMALGFVVAVVAVVAVFAFAAMHGCSGTQLDRDMHAADDLGLAANRAEPVWMSAYRLDGRHAADAACTNTADATCVQRRLDAVQSAEARWMRVRRQWEIAVADHDALSTCLESAHRSDGGVCPDQAARQAALTASVMTYRCEVRAIGHAELDPLGSNGLVCPGSATDGGAL